MKYTFQDSVDLPVQRDFIQDLRDFIEVAKKVLSLENLAIEMNDETKTEMVSIEKRLNDLDKFENDVINFIDNLSKDVEAREILECRNTLLDTCATLATKNRVNLKEDFKRRKKVLEHEVLRVESEIISALSPFFEASVYGTEKKYAASMDNGLLKGKLRASVAGMEYQSDLSFVNEVLTVQKVSGNLFLPTWTKSGLLHKEDKVKMVDVSDFVVVSVNHEGDEHIDAVFENKKQGHTFKVSRDDAIYHVYYDGNDITADNTLIKSLKLEDVTTLLNELKTYIEIYIRSQTLKKVLLDGEDAVKNNVVFDCLKLIAERYGEIIRECIERGYVKNEITIKIEQADGARTEKYISTEEASDQLSEIGEGIELAEILGFKMS
ncbi:MAG: hypothetical protein JXA98_00665 [Methanosarcinaceae archaeon]|nr:hypothetical protein [Methanosarcinaceae archaeon]